MGREADSMTGLGIDYTVVLRERAEAPAPRRSEQLAALAEPLDGGTSATLARAVREGGVTTDQPAFEYGPRMRIDGTAAALTMPPRPA